MHEIYYDMAPKNKDYGVREMLQRFLVKTCFCSNEYAYNSRGSVGGSVSYRSAMSQ
jgi:hypothetical protein